MNTFNVKERKEEVKGEEGIVVTNGMGRKWQGNWFYVRRL